jgi:hypothetical protein
MLAEIKESVFFQFCPLVHNPVAAIGPLLLWQTTTAAGNHCVANIRLLLPRPRCRFPTYHICAQSTTRRRAAGHVGVINPLLSFPCSPSGSTPI